MALFLATVIIAIDSSDSDDYKAPDTSIAGFVIGGFILLVLVITLIIVVVILYKHHNKKRLNYSSNDQQSDQERLLATAPISPPPPYAGSNVQPAAANSSTYDANTANTGGYQQSAGPQPEHACITEQQTGSSLHDAHA